jgi:hypothetical protein
MASEGSRQRAVPREQVLERRAAMPAQAAR